MNDASVSAPPEQAQAPHSDVDLLRRIGAGDEKAFEQLYKRHYQLLFNFVYRLTRRLDLVEEVVNDVMFVVWQKAGSVHLTARASTWILGIAYKKSLKALQQVRLKGGDVALNQVVHNVPDDSGCMMERIESAELLHMALASLSPDQRASLELAYYHGMHYADIAALMECPEATVKTRIYHARQKLRSQLGDLSGESARNKRAAL